MYSWNVLVHEGSIKVDAGRSLTTVVYSEVFTVQCALVSPLHRCQDEREPLLVERRAGGEEGCGHIVSVACTSTHPPAAPALLCCSLCANVGIALHTPLASMQQAQP